MSEVGSPGPGWWRASDGHWYPGRPAGERTPAWRRPLYQFGAVGLAGLLVGSMLAAAGAGDDAGTRRKLALASEESRAARGEVGDLRADVSHLKLQRELAEGRATSAEARVKTLEESLAKAEPELRARLDGEYAARAAELGKREAELSARASQLDARERAVGVAEKKAAENSFGSGVHRVGVDIKAGRYRADAARSGCYWAKLHENDDIIDNYLQFEPGPVNVTIEATVYKFETHDCGTWRRVA
jgi:hypothetical protein